MVDTISESGSVGTLVKEIGVALRFTTRTVIYAKDPFSPDASFRTMTVRSEEIDNSVDGPLKNLRSPTAAA